MDCTTVLTFDPHPLSVLRPDRAPKLLSDWTQKLRRMAAIGVSEVIVIPFDRDWARQSAREFIDDILVGALDVRQVTIGANFRFGNGGTGGTELLRADRRLITRVVPLVTIENDVVSSTLIRRLIAAGDVDKASELLGSPLEYTGRLRRKSNGGEGAAWMDADRGRALPGPGIYRCRVNGNPAVVRVETHGFRLLLDVTARSAARTTEGEWVTVKFLGRHRDLEKSA